MIKNVSRLRNRLGYAGLIPFIGFALAMLIAPQATGQLALVGFASYSAIISSFMAGSLWGQALHIADTATVRVFIVSNSLCLLAWIGMLLCWVWPEVGLLLLSLSFIGIMILEHQHVSPLLNTGHKPTMVSYKHLRWFLTAMVLGCHGLALFAQVNLYD